MVVPPRLNAAHTIYDVGGGKHPYIGTDMAKPKGVRIVGLDIDKNELLRAPRGIYDQQIVSDISAPNLQVKVPRQATVICEAVLEHVQNNVEAVHNIAKLCGKRGQAIIFVPSRYALFAMINRLLPQQIKRKLLFGIFPETEGAQGFPAYYDHCTPKAMSSLLLANGFTIAELKCYYRSTYFSFFVPLHVLWRCYQVAAYSILGKDAAESFSIVATKGGY